jgi:hypothetical protein
VLKGGLPELCPSGTIAILPSIPALDATYALAEVRFLALTGFWFDFLFQHQLNQPIKQTMVRSMRGWVICWVNNQGRGIRHDAKKYGITID